MNAGKRWAYHFVAELECVRCRRKDGLTLYLFRDRLEKVDSTAYSPWELKALVPHMDVWCATCVPKITTRVTSQGRQDHKAEAARMADIRTGAQKASTFDVYRLKGIDVSKIDFLEHIKDRLCAQCGHAYPSVVMELFHPTQRMSTMREILDNIDEAVVICSNCKRMIQAGLLPTPKPNITLDENFWSNLKTI